MSRAAQAQPPVPGHGAEAGAGALKVMIIDDDREFADELAESLRGAGYAVEAFVDSVIAFHEVHRVKPAIIILDLMMDNVNGYLATWYFRKFPETATVPIIGMSAYAGDADPNQVAASGGMNAFLQKPFTPPAMIAKIEQLTGAAPADAYPVEVIFPRARFAAANVRQGLGTGSGIPAAGARAAGRSGFTLIELLVTAAIVSILAVAAVPKFMSTLDKARIGKAIAEITVIRDAIELFRAQHSGRLPADMAELIPDSLGNAPLDPWGNPYVFNVLKTTPTTEWRVDLTVPINDEYDIYSLGRNGNTFAEIHHGNSRDDIIMARNGGFIGPATEY